MKLLNTIVTATLLIFSLAVNGYAQDDGETVEDFSFKDIKGKNHKFSDYRGKWVIVNYWGTYCPPCLEEIPDLVNFAENHKKDAVVLGMDAGGTDIEGLTTFAEENLMDYTIAPVQESTLTAFGILLGIPTTYVVTPKGQVAARVVGLIDMDSVEQLMAQHEGENEGKKVSQDSIFDEYDIDEILDL